MSYDWTEFLDFAERLRMAPDSPVPPGAALRSAASRAYYPAFHYAIAFARQEGFDPRYSGDDHRRIQAHFRQHGTPGKTRKKIAKELERLLDHRHWADYRSRVHKRLDSLASHAIGMAKSIVENLDSLEPESL